MAFRVINHSGWPTRALKTLGFWVVSREWLGLHCDYHLILKNTHRRSWFHGSGNAESQTISLHRRFQPPDGKWPLMKKDRRFKWSTRHVLRSRLELLIYIMAHEAHHARGGSPSHFMKSGRLDRASMEYRCNAAAMDRSGRSSEASSLDTTSAATDSSTSSAKRWSRSWARR